LQTSEEKGNLVTIDWRPHSEIIQALGAPTACDVSADAIATFQSDGVVLLRGAFVDWVDRLRAGLQRNMDYPNDYAFPCDSVAPGEKGRFFDSYCNWHRIPEYTEFVGSSAAASMACQFMRSASAQFFHEHVFCKDAGTQTATPWHHDLPYYCVDGWQNVSIYVSLDFTPANTAVRFLAGSHRSGQLYYPRHFLDGSDYVLDDPTMSGVAPLEDAFQEKDLRAFELEPGDTLLFDFRTLHGTTAAETKTQRRAFSTRWLGDDMVYFERPGETSPPLKDLGVQPGMRMPEDLFPVVWPDLGLE
jgi:ectoine hydroxylase-related dioxygenase (phytanoyl-CoA dioxygenase family)